MHPLIEFWFQFSLAEYLSYALGLAVWLFWTR